MRKDKVFEMFVLAAREVFQRGKLPDGANTFFDLVRQYSKNVVTDIKESELVEISKFMAHLTQRVPDLGRAVANPSNCELIHCPNPLCNDEGWYAEGSHEDGWEQIQCEFCWTNPFSYFNAWLRDLEE